VRKPLIVYVSGAPGAGKTTLARQIAQQFYVPHVASDLVQGGVRLTGEGINDRKKTLLSVFVPLLVNMAKMNISFVVDHVLQKGRSETDIIDKLRPHAKLVYIHVYAANAIDRFYKREKSRTDKGVVLSPDELLTRRDFHRDNLINTETSLDIDIPCLKVNTEAEYKPNLPYILEFIEKEYLKEEKA